MDVDGVQAGRPVQVVDAGGAHSKDASRLLAPEDAEEAGDAALGHSLEHQVRPLQPHLRPGGDDVVEHDGQGKAALDIWQLLGVDEAAVKEGGLGRGRRGRRRGGERALRRRDAVEDLRGAAGEDTCCGQDANGDDERQKRRCSAGDRLSSTAVGQPGR